MKTLLLLALALGPTAFAARYGVPVPADLASQSYFDIGKVSAELTDGKLEVYYHLPTGLVGKIHSGFHFSGDTRNGSFVSVEGAGVYGVCMVASAKPMTCMLKYPELAIDTPSRDEVLRSQFSGDQLVLRQEVARVFSNDPAGILVVDVLRRPAP